MQNIDFSTPGQCECGKRFLGYREAREPATNLGRDEALADVTQWLELIGSRCFLGLRHYLSSDSQIDRFTQHVSRLTEPLQLSAPPQWWPPNFNLPHAFLPKMTFHVYGGMALRSGSSKLDSLHRRFYTPHKTQNPYTYQNIIEADFKSIKRYLMHHAVQNCRKWISKFASASDATRIVDMLNNGGDDARNAWAILIWWQSSVWTLNLRDMTRKNSLKVLFDSDIPVLQYQDSNDPYFTLQLQGAQEWVMRWLNATSLITQWCAAKAEAFCAWSPYDLVWGRGVLGMRPVPSWSAGLNDQQRMLLYVDRPLGFRWAKNNRPIKAERQTQFLEQAGVRFDVLRTVSLQSCRWYHGVNMEWDSAPGPIPMEVKDCKRHHMTFEGKRYLFLVFPWLQTNDERRPFVARCLDIPLAATGQSPKEAIYSLKFAIHRYCILIAKTA